MADVSVVSQVSQAGGGDKDARFRLGDKIGPFTLLKHIGIGGNGDVYEVAKENSMEKVIMKVAKKEYGATSVAFEDMVMSHVIAKHKEDRTLCLVRKFESGVIDDAQRLPQLTVEVDDMYLVMESLKGSAVEALRNYQKLNDGLDKILDWGIELLRGLYDMHQIGLLHRDVKPENVGMFEEKNTVIFDMGMVRNFLDEKGEVRTPRTHVGLRGTDEWASFNTELGGEQGPADDLWGWFYTMIEWLNTYTEKHSYQAWTPYDTNDKFKNDIHCIRQFMKSPYFPASLILDNCPSCFYRLQLYLRTLSRTDVPDYLYLASLLKDSKKKSKRKMKPHPVKKAQFLEELFQQERLWL